MHCLLGASGYAVRLTPKNPSAASSRKLAAKVIDKTTKRISSRHTAMFRDEIKIMQEMKHDNIIDWMDVYEDSRRLYIVMELCEGGELFDRIKKRVCICMGVDGLSVSCSMVLYLSVSCSM